MSFSISNSKHKTAIVFGASSGLGFELAKCLGQDGFAVLLVGRDQQRLKTATGIVKTAGAPKANYLAIDVSAVDRDELKDRVVAAISEMNSVSDDATTIDISINAIGVSDRGNLLQLTDIECHQSLDQNVISTLRCVYATRELLARVDGCVVNIGSLASLFAPAGVGGYAMAKFALAGVTQQLRMEHRSDGIHFLLVCPGPITSERTESRYSDKIEQRGLGSDAARPGAGAKISSLNPERLAQDILHSAKKRRFILIRPRKVALLYIIQSCSPKLGDWLLQKFSGRT